MADNEIHHDHHQNIVDLPFFTITVLAYIGPET